MKTEIFNSYEDFLARPDKSVNGVSKVFVENCKDWEIQNEKNTGCWDCRDCSYCRNCRNCRDCRDCSYCRNCRDCRDCSYCRNCRDCSYCRDCRNCSNCSNCSYFNKNPQRIVSPKLGSENRQTTIYWNDSKAHVICGCFSGDIQEFKDKVLETHGNNKFAKGYLTFIKLAEIYIESSRSLSN